MNRRSMGFGPSRRSRHYRSRCTWATRLRSGGAYGERLTETALSERDSRIRPPAEPWEDPATVAPLSRSIYSPEARFSSAMSAFSSATSACSVRRSVA